MSLRWTSRCTRDTVADHGSPIGRSDVFKQVALYSTMHLISHSDKFKRQQPGVHSTARLQVQDIKPELSGTVSKHDVSGRGGGNSGTK